MLKKTMKLCPTNCLSNILRVKMYSTSGKPDRKWDLMSAVCVERHPIISAPKTELEESFHNMLMEIEIEKSMKSDHELKVESEIKQMKMLKKGLLNIDSAQKVETAQDIEESGEKQLKAFNFAPRITEADEKNIKNSLQRKLDRNLLLLVQQKLGKENLWMPPLGLRNDGESMREAAERVLKSVCGEDLNVRIYGNAPMGYYQYQYPLSKRKEGVYGAKVFYYLARYMKGSIPDKINYVWLDRIEIAQHLPAKMYPSISKFLINED